MGRKNIIQEQKIKQEIDAQGEIITEVETVNRTVKIPNSCEPDYVKLYIADAISLASIDITAKFNTRVDVVYAMLVYMDYRNEIVLNKSRRDEICDKCHTTIDNLNKILKNLIQKQVLMNKFDKEGKVVRGTFIVNPYYFGRGKWEDIYNLRLTIDYNPHQKRFIQVERNPEKQLDLAI